MFLLPSLTPKTLEDLASKPDEAAILAKKEAELKEKVFPAGTSTLHHPFLLNVNFGSQTVTIVQTVVLHCPPV